MPSASGAGAVVSGGDGTPVQFESQHGAKACGGSGPRVQPVAAGAEVGGVVIGGAVSAGTVVDGRAVVAGAVVTVVVGRTVVAGAAVVAGTEEATEDAVEVTAEALVLRTSAELPQPATSSSATTNDEPARTPTPRP
jgi:hypothetical protein